MAKKNMTATQMKMFEEMVRADFKKLLDQVKEYREALREQANFEVSKRLGLFELKVQEKKLELELEQVRTKIASIFGHTSYSDERERFNEAVERELSALLASVGDGALAEVTAAHEMFIRKIRLTSLTDELKDVFTSEIPKQIEKLSANMTLLPPPPKVGRDAIELLLPTSR